MVVVVGGGSGGSGGSGGRGELRADTTITFDTDNGRFTVYRADL